MGGCTSRPPSYTNTLAHRIALKEWRNAGIYPSDWYKSCGLYRCEQNNLVVSTFRKAQKGPILSHDEFIEMLADSFIAARINKSTIDSECLEKAVDRKINRTST